MLRRQGLGVVADGRSRNLLEERVLAWKSRIRAEQGQGLGRRHRNWVKSVEGVGVVVEGERKGCGNGCRKERERVWEQL